LIPVLISTCPEDVSFFLRNDGFSILLAQCELEGHSWAARNRIWGRILDDRLEFFRNAKNELRAKESVMNSSWIRKALLVSVLAGACLAIGCGGGVEGKYRDPSGGINVEFKGGKAYIALGAYAVDGTYKVEGNKIVARGDFGLMLHSPLVFTINSDGTLDGPRDSMIPRLEKVK
jgi:hypothetical protein